MNSNSGYEFRACRGIAGGEAWLRIIRLLKNTEIFYFVLSPFRVFVIGFNYFEAQIIRNLQTHYEVNLKHRAIIFKSV